MSEKNSSLSLPEVNSRWQHHSGMVYQVLCISNLKATKPDYPVTVVYVDTDGDIWSHPLEFWHNRMSLIS
jgi:hypothetical protein